MSDVGNATTPQPGKRDNGWQSRYALLRNYLIVAVPLLVILALVVLGTAVWQARQSAAAQLAQEIGLLAKAREATDSAEPSILLTDLPDPVLPRTLFIIDGNTPSTIIARAGSQPTAETWSIPRSAPLPGSRSSTGTTYTTGNQMNGQLYHFWQPDDAAYAFIASVESSDLFRQALRSAIVPLTSLAVLFCLGGGIIESVERLRARQFQQLAEASMLVTKGELGTSIDVGGSSDLGKLGAMFDRMRQALKERIDNSSLLLQVSQDVTTTRDIDHGMDIILKGLLTATEAQGARAVVFNPNGSKPLRFGVGDEATGRMGTLDRRLLNLIRNADGDVLLRSAERIRAALDLPETRELPVGSLIAFPLYSMARLHGLLWVGYADEMTHEPSEIDLMRSYVTRASAMVANMRLYALAEGGFRRLAAVLSSTQEAVVVTDNTDRIVLVNPALGSAFGVDVDAAVGRTVADAFEHTGLTAILTGSLSDASGREVVNAAGETFHATASIVEAKDDQIVGRVVVLHDITRMKHLEEMKSNFVRNVSHDLRNPLAYMHTYASMLPELGSLNDKQQEYVLNIVNGIQRMHDTIGAVLNLNRIESATDELEIEAIDVMDLFTVLASEHGPAARSQGNDIVLAVPNPVTVYADRWSLRLALNNLIANALRYAPESGDIVLRAKVSAENTVLSVSDNGIGISKADQLRLFEKYYRASEPAVPSVEGSGLGLAIVKSIAQRHSGRAWVRSQLGQGSTFFIALPTQQTITSAPIPAEEPEQLMPA